MSLRQARKEKTRLRILEASASLFLKNDFISVSIEDIAQEVGISKGAVFYHFPTKTELAFETLKWFVEEKYIKILEKHQSEPKSELLRKIIFESITISLEYSRMLNFIFQMLSKGDSSQYSTLLNQVFQPYFQVIIQEMESAKVPNPERKALLLFAMIDGLSFRMAMQMQLEQKKFSEEDVTTLTDEIILLFFGKP